MAFYSGETFLVEVELSDYLNAPLTDSAVSSVDGTLLSSDRGTVIVPSFEFEYVVSGGRPTWVGEFSTDGVESGTYSLKMTVTANDSSTNWEYSTLVLRP